MIIFLHFPSRYVLYHIRRLAHSRRFVIGNACLEWTMDTRQIPFPDQSVWQFDWTNIHYVRRNWLPEPRLPTCIPPPVSFAPLKLTRPPVLYRLPSILPIICNIFGWIDPRWVHHTPKMSIFLTTEHSVRCNAYLCNLEIQAPRRNVGEYAVYFLWYSHFCGGFLLLAAEWWSWVMYQPFNFYWYITNFGSYSVWTFGWSPSMHCARISYVA